MAAERNEALLDWYDEQRRDLPWRRTTDPWPILVSEIMSQQTQIARVVPAWSRFMERYPAPSDLAIAERTEVIELWAGLGYQRRLFHLVAAAESIARHGWPKDVDGLRKLPGVGPYTAAAVACFAFGAPVAAVDTNLKRILSRWQGGVLSGRELEDEAAAALAVDRPEDWNQAMMDLGAMVCRPSTPACGECPVEVWCADPTIYEPPPRQSTYEGSVRQARAAVLRQLASDGPSPVDVLAPQLERETVRRAVEALCNEQRIGVEADLVRVL